MESSRRRFAGQPGPVENARQPLPYAQIPIALLCVPPGERAAAIEVWATLHYHLRLGSSPQRVRDEELMSASWMAERSVEHARKGLECLEREELICRQSRGSSRLLAILARLKGPHRHKVDKPIVARITAQPLNDVTMPQEEWAQMLRLLVSGNQQG